jgi:hypothetical protein
MVDTSYTDESRNIFSAYANLNESDSFDLKDRTKGSSPSMIKVFDLTKDS